MLKSRGLKIISSAFEILLALSQIVRFFRSIFKSLFNLFSNLLMIRRFVSSAKWWTLQGFIATFRLLIYSWKRKGLKTDPCSTPHLIIKVFDAKQLIDTNCLQFHVFHSDTICSTECYNPQYQKPSEGQ